MIGGDQEPLELLHEVITPDRVIDQARPLRSEIPGNGRHDSILAQPAGEKYGLNRKQAIAHFRFSPARSAAVAGGLEGPAGLAAEGGRRRQGCSLCVWFGITGRTSLDGTAPPRPIVLVVLPFSIVVEVPDRPVAARAPGCSSGSSSPSGTRGRPGRSGRGSGCTCPSRAEHRPPRARSGPGRSRSRRPGRSSGARPAASRSGRRSPCRRAGPRSG